jgi:hypothetical protein
MLEERFAGPGLDPAVWIDSYLPAWSSRAASRATWEIGPGGLRLSIPAGQACWCPDLHDGALRVSAVQTGNRSGPVGSTLGQQAFRDGLVVREEQPELLGYTPHFGRVDVECRARLGPRSMFSAWMVGLEDRPERCGEICIVEVFGDTLRPRSADVGSGIKAIRDPGLTQEFSAPPTVIDVAQPHVYGVDWRPGGVDFFLDGRRTRTTTQSPGYPMQLILGVFDFPDRPGPDGHEPELVVRAVRGS